VVFGLLLRASLDVMVEYGMLPSTTLTVPAVIECAAVLAFIWNLGVFKRTTDSLEGLDGESRAY
jgi:hypothetical protein